MIRVLSGSVIPILGLGAAIALLGPDQLTGPRGEPLVVEAPAASALQPASFDGGTCALPLLLSEDDQLLAKALAAGSGLTVVTLAVTIGADGSSVEVGEGVIDADADAVAFVILDAHGQIVAVTNPAPRRQHSAAENATGCLGPSPVEQPAGI
jgi:hypothetical protein